ncbi:MAG: MraY family glycosyltransferase [Meiothermus sp.]|nr:MraY family glycosyltransferase [Meiothermus sp.]
MSLWLILLLATASGIGFVWLSIHLARAWGIVDSPGAIKIHSKVTPRFGGFGIVLTVLFWGLISGALTGWALLGLLIIAVTGGLDDKYSLLPKVRLAAEVVAGAALGMHFWEPLGLLGLILGVGLVPVMSNAVNLIDGMNGLASGNSLISALGLALLLEAANLPPTLALILAGGLIGFLVWNYPRAKTFMGDCGSLSIGYVLAALVMLAATHGFMAFVAAMVMVSFPLYDLVCGFIRRWRRGKPIFDGDRDHTYDRLDQLHLRNPAVTVVVVWGVTALLVAVGMVVSGMGFLSALLLITLVMSGLFFAAHWLGSL